FYKSRCKLSLSLKCGIIDLNDVNVQIALGLGFVFTDTLGPSVKCYFEESLDRSKPKKIKYQGNPKATQRIECYK
ncbi:282_t:CDS:2, partial [Entrophospora sp. SA101]